MPHESSKLLTAEQYLLTTLMVKLALVAVLSTMLVRFPWFRRILLTEKRDWPERLVFAASLGVPLTAGVIARLRHRAELQQHKGPSHVAGPCLAEEHRWPVEQAYQDADDDDLDGGKAERFFQAQHDFDVTRGEHVRDVIAVPDEPNCVLDLQVARQRAANFELFASSCEASACGSPANGGSAVAIESVYAAGSSPRCWHTVKRLRGPCRLHRRSDGPLLASAA